MIKGLVGALVVAGLCAQGVKAPDLGYDPRAALAIREALVKDFGFARLLDLSYESPRGGRVSGYALVPAGVGHPAGIVWQHWGQGDRSSLLPEALTLARKGACSILINSPANRPGVPEPKTAEESLALWLQDAVDIRRAVDALVGHYGARPERLAYVGHSYGATLGGLLAVSERRFHALVLMGGFASISDSIRRPKTGPAGSESAAKVFSVIDAEQYIGRAAPAALLLQFAQYDRFISEEQAKRYAAAASNPKLVRWYDCGHEFNDAQSAADREEWLGRELALKGR